MSLSRGGDPDPDLAEGVQAIAAGGKGCSAKPSFSRYRVRCQLLRDVFVSQRTAIGWLETTRRRWSPKPGCACATGHPLLLHCKGVDAVVLGPSSSANARGRRFSVPHTMRTWCRHSRFAKCAAALLVRSTTARTWLSRHGMPEQAVDIAVEVREGHRFRVVVGPARPLRVGLPAQLVTIGLDSGLDRLQARRGGGRPGTCGRERPIPAWQLVDAQAQDRLQMVEQGPASLQSRHGPRDAGAEAECGQHYRDLPARAARPRIAARAAGRDESRAGRDAVWAPASR